MCVLHFCSELERKIKWKISRMSFFLELAEIKSITLVIRTKLNKTTWKILKGYKNKRDIKAPKIKLKETLKIC